MTSAAEEFPRDAVRLFEIKEASTITVTPETIIIVPRPKDPIETVKRYRRNVWWFLLLVVLSSAWFYRHFETYFSQALVVGIPLTYAVWQVALSYWKSFWEKNAEELRRRWLSHESTTLQLVGLCVAMALFLALTSSVWISLAPGPIKSAAVEVRYEGEQFMPTIEVSDTSRIGGRPFFPRFIPRRVEFTVTSPKRWVKNGSKSVMLWPWKAMNLKFPDDFHERPKRAIRIVPGTSLRDDVPDDNSPYTLTIQEGTAPARTYPHYPFATVYAGLAEWDELREAYGQHNTPAWGDSLERALIADGSKPANAKRYASIWLSRSVIARMNDFSDNSVIKVTLGIPGQPPIASATSKKLTSEMTTLTLEKDL